MSLRRRVRGVVAQVCDNQPWRLVFGMLGPLVGAFAFSAFSLISTSVRQLATTMGPGSPGGSGARLDGRHGRLAHANLIAAAIVLTPQVFGQYAGSDPGVAEHAVAMLLVTAAATVAGAIGSGFESGDTIREAAYSRRERERREALRELQQRREQEELSGDPAER